MQPFSFFFFFVIHWGGGGVISGRVRALNLTVPLGSGRVGSDDLGYGPRVADPCPMLSIHTLLSNDPPGDVTARFVLLNCLTRFSSSFMSPATPFIILNGITIFIGVHCPFQTPCRFLLIFRSPCNHHISARVRL